MIYILIYIIVGCLLAGAALFHKTFSKDKTLTATFLTILIWPLMLFVAPESFFSSRKIENDIYSSQPDSLKNEFTTLMQDYSSLLTEEERQRLEKVSKYGEEQLTIFENRANFEDILSKFWNSNIPPEIYHSFNRAILHLNDNDRDDSENSGMPARFSLVAPDWYIGFSNEFVKSIANVDKKKQGRILEAVHKIAIAPVEIHGDTIKPLTGNLAGLWRYRLGDDRLIYYPNIESKRVVLISFASRGEAYEEIPNISAITNHFNNSTKTDR